MTTNNENEENVIIDKSIVLHILNTKNKFITIEYVNDLLKQYNVDFEVTDISKFIEATIHISYMNINLEMNNSKLTNKKRYSLLKDKEVAPITNPLNAIPLQDISYERIEFLGDSIIRAILSEYFYCRYKNQNEGFLTKLRTKIEKHESLANLCKIIKLNEYIIISKYIEEKGGREQNSKIHEDAFEAFIGALHLNGGYNVCKKFIINLIETKVDISELLHNEDNYKDLLLQFFHKKKWKDPKYELIKETGIETKREFTMCVKDDKGTIYGIGIGASKKKGEQEAARIALEKFGSFDKSASESEYEEADDKSLVSSDSDNLDYLDTDSE